MYTMERAHCDHVKRGGEVCGAKAVADSARCRKHKTSTGHLPCEAGCGRYYQARPNRKNASPGRCAHCSAPVYLRRSPERVGAPEAGDVPSPASLPASADVGVLAPEAAVKLPSDGGETAPADADPAADAAAA